MGFQGARKYCIFYSGYICSEDCDKLSYGIFLMILFLNIFIRFSSSFKKLLLFFFIFLKSALCVENVWHDLNWAFLALCCTFYKWCVTYFEDNEKPFKIILKLLLLLSHATFFKKSTKYNYLDFLPKHIFIKAETVKPGQYVNSEVGREYTLQYIWLVVTEAFYTGPIVLLQFDGSDDSKLWYISAILCSCNKDNLLFASSTIVIIPSFSYSLLVISLNIWSACTNQLFRFCVCLCF